MISGTGGETFAIFEGMDAASTELIYVEVKRDANGYFMRLQARQDDQSWVETPYVKLSDALQSKGWQSAVWSLH